MSIVKLLLRQMRANKLMTIINVFGLAVAMTVTLLIAVFIYHEMSYEKCIPRAEHIVLGGTKGYIGSDQQLNFPLMSASMAVDLTDEVAGIRNYARIQRSDGSVTVDMRPFTEENVIFADSAFFKITGLPLLQGDPESVLNRPNTVVLAQSTAKKYFGDENPIGREILHRNRTSLTITGVMADIEGPSIFEEVPLVGSWSTHFKAERDQRSWINQVNWYVLFELAESAVPEDIMPAALESTERHAGEIMRQIGGEIFPTFTPLLDVHLYGDYKAWDSFTYNRWPVVAQFMAIALFTLLIAVLNYVNMTTAQATRRGMLVGVSKTMGAPRSALVRQFLAESILVTIIAALLGVLLAALALPTFENMVGVELSLAPLFGVQGVLIMAVSAILVGLVAGGYPALVISGFKPSEVLRRELVTGRKGSRLRSVLVIVQFSVAVVLILSSLVVLRQMEYIRHKNLGFDRENVLTVRIGSWELMQNYRVLYDEFRKLPFVVSSTTADDTPLSTSNNSVYHIPGTPMDSQVFIASQSVDHDYIDAMGIKLVEGRNFDRNRPTDSTDVVIINQTAAKYLGYENPVGMGIEEIEGLDPLTYKNLEIIGVIEDMHFEPLRTEVRPFFLRIYRGYPPWLLFRIQKGAEQQAISALEKLWSGFSSDVGLNYRFLDDSYDALYREEERLSKMFNGFTVIAIFVASLGLFALATFAAERRIKEIGIRKTLGASSLEIVRLLVVEFMTLVGIANLIAWPVAWWLMNGWLQGFAYRADFAWWLFAATGALSVIVALITVSSQALRASLINPVNALRYE
jgi:putative ABC transport system permease protein